MMTKVSPTDGFTGAGRIWREKAKKRIRFRGRIPGGAAKPAPRPVQTVLGCFNLIGSCVDGLASSYHLLP